MRTQRLQQITEFERHVRPLQIQHVSASLRPVLLSELQIIVILQYSVRNVAGIYQPLYPPMTSAAFTAHNICFGSIRIEFFQ